MDTDLAPLGVVMLTGAILLVLLAVFVPYRIRALGRMPVVSPRDPAARRAQQVELARTSDLQVAAVTVAAVGMLVLVVVGGVASIGGQGSEEGSSIDCEAFERNQDEFVDGDQDERDQVFLDSAQYLENCR